MALKLYNTLSRKKEVFKPIKKGEVGVYTCGPTVYWYQHIGNLRSYIFSDVLTRVLKYDKYKVKQVVNVTDVGHLTSDADDGEDKLEKAAAKEHKTAKEISHFYFDIFKEDFVKLNIEMPSVWSWATKHIGEQIELIKKLEKKGFTYETSDGIYFDTSKFGDYGKLSRKKIDGLEAGKRITLKEKRSITDFALWKFSKDGENRQQEWASPWGKGYPGWHIECSAMSMKYLGATIDIHTGGEDHIPIHHENEIAQSEAATGKKFVNYWMHGAFLQLGGKKMAKSSGKILTISELEEKGFSPLDYRYFTFSAHYRKPLSWSLGGLETARDSLKRLKRIISGLNKEKGTNKKYLGRFEEKINDDLNMPGALAVLWELVRDKNAKNKYGTIEKMDEVFGLNLFEKIEIKVPAEIKKLAEERQKAREEKNWAKSDELRDEISKKGWKVIDGKERFQLGEI
ncbi:cysteine--tRNA ligase [Candidatus Pacearchaeota archaeon]|jgi:cysteinyl-tRNA synthetase|nr:cysteine--tRNA ligase [Candidatus Pacearchaeota archaeon]|tara:strand:+ start:2670 stop:4034 length:1365 start_codon:yes stop_codon:yes gene_type:complete